MEKAFPTLLFVLLCLYLHSPVSYAQKFEAESAALSNGAAKISCASCSGGAYVDLVKGSISFEVELIEEGFYDIEIYAAAPGGDKINVFSLNSTSGDFTFKKNSQYTSHQIVEAYKLDAGNHLVEISSSWGYINIDYISFHKIAATRRFKLTQELIAPEPTPEAKALFDFLLDNYGDKIISGVMTLNSMDMPDWLKEKTGKEPALLGIDFMHSGRGYNWYNDEEPIIDASTWYARNGIPALMWHWRDPLRETEEFYVRGNNHPNGTTFDISKISEENSQEYKAMLEDIDFISGLLKQLQDDHVPVIWRPLHEAAGGWFWWGAKGAAPLKELWILMYDRMVNHHGLNNLIWVWTSEPGDQEWYPGDEYVDIVGRDIYKEGDHSSQAIDFYSLNSKFSRQKMVALSEVGSFPDPDKLIEDGAAWSWFMPWYGAHTQDSKHNSLELWDKTLHHEYVISLDEMPELKTYQRQDSLLAPEPVDSLPTGLLHRQKYQSSLLVYPNPVEDKFTIISPKRIETVKIFNSLGGEEKAIRLLNGYKVEIKLPELKQGIYFVQVNGESITRIFKK